jgi:tRNA G18 (ribose-2'-O)-methylase SpoU
MPLVPIASLSDPRLDPYRSLKQTNLTRDSGRFIAEGKLVVERLLASRFQVDSVLLSERRLPLWESLLRVGDSPVYVVSEETARQLLGFHFHAGVLACGRRGPRFTVHDLLAALDTEPHLLVACPHMTDPDNLGSLIRVARALGVGGLLLGRGCCDPFSRRTLRVSMGNALELPIVESRDLADDLRCLQREHGFTLTATVVDPGAQPLHQTQGVPRDVLLLGNEAHGLGPEWRSFCDRQVTIPMSAGVDSLNVALAAGICLHWLRWGGGS